MMNSRSRRMVEEGFCVFEKVFTPEDLDPIRKVSIQAVKSLSTDHRVRNKSQGSLILIADYPEFSHLIGHEKLAHLFTEMEFSDPRFNSGYIISKPAFSPALFWHQDWWGWNHQFSYTSEIAQFFVMVYLQDTNVENGCLRVIPGTHRVPHPFHESQDAHAESLSRVDDPHDPLYLHVKGQVEVPVRYGDVVFGDSRLIHSSFPNQSQEERTLITLWFHPHYARLPEAIQARIYEMFQRKGVDTDPDGPNSMTLPNWPPHYRRKVESLFPHCPENVEPNPWCREPDWPEK